MANILESQAKRPKGDRKYWYEEDEEEDFWNQNVSFASDAAS